jgi:phytoene dehydrogenase-like protein
VQVLSRDLDETVAALDGFAPRDGAAWRELYALWQRLRPGALRLLGTPLPALGPMLRVLRALGPREALRTARMLALPVRRFGDERFAGEGGKRLVAGCTLHADLSPDTALGAFYGFLLAALGQDVGFPVPAGGAGALTAALVERLRTRGGRVECGVRADEVVVRGGRAVGVRAGGEVVEAHRAVLGAVDAPQLYGTLARSEHLPSRLRVDLQRFDWDWSTVKVDWTLDGPVPWRVDEARRAPVVHLAEGVDALTTYAAEIATGALPRRPFVLFGQYSMVDPSRAPDGKEVAWAYTHVEGEIEALAPGFGKLVRRRRILGPAELEATNRSLRGGALNGGTAQLHQQLLFRPVPGLGRPTTPVPRLYLAGASAHPGGGVHGGPGAIAARVALRKARLRR